MRRRAIRSATILAVGLLLLPTLAAAAPGARWSGGSRGPGGHANHGGGGARWNKWSGHGGGHWHGSGGCCWGWGGFAVGLGVGALLTAPFWAYPRVYAAPAFPVYAPPYPAYPAYPAAYPTYAPGPVYPATPPPPPALTAPDASSGLAPTPAPSFSTTGQSLGVLPTGSGDRLPTAPPAGCESVTVAGHWETRAYPDGQRLTVWIPTSVRSVCR